MPPAQSVLKSSHVVDRVKKYPNREQGLGCSAHREMMASSLFSEGCKYFLSCSIVERQLATKTN